MKIRLVAALVGLAISLALDFRTTERNARSTSNPAARRIRSEAYAIDDAAPLATFSRETQLL
jgi:hypothetical protein